MFEQEYRPQQQISRQAAEHYAIMVAITASRANASAYAGSGERFARLGHLWLKRHDRPRNVP